MGAQHCVYLTPKKGNWLTVVVGPWLRPGCLAALCVNAGEVKGFPGVNRVWAGVCVVWGYWDISL